MTTDIYGNKDHRWQHKIIIPEFNIILSGALQEQLVTTPAIYIDIPDAISAFPVFERIWAAELDQLGSNQGLKIEIPSQGPAQENDILRTYKLEKECNDNSKIECHNLFRAVFELYCDLAAKLLVGQLPSWIHILRETPEQIMPKTNHQDSLWKKLYIEQKQNMKCIPF